jgi:hypothetical protein
VRGEPNATALPITARNEPTTCRRAGIEKPASWLDAIIPAAIDAGNVVVAGSTAAQGGALGDLEQLLEQVCWRPPPSLPSTV